MVFGSTGMQYSFYSSLPIFIGFLQKLVLPGLGNAWRCVTSPHLSVRTPPATRLKLSHEEEPAGWFAGGKRENLHDGLHKMGPPFAENPSRMAALGTPAWSILGEFLSAFSIGVDCRKPSCLPAPVAATSPAEEGKRIPSSSIIVIRSFLALAWAVDRSRSFLSIHTKLIVSSKLPMKKLVFLHNLIQYYFFSHFFPVPLLSSSMANDVVCASAAVTGQKQSASGGSCISL